MMQNRINTLILVFCMAFPFVSRSQTQSKGEVQDQEFVIRKDRVLTVPNQPRAFEKLPVLPQPKGLSNFNYPISRYTLNLKPLSLEATPIQKNYRLDRRDLYNGFIRAGYGNFKSPLIEARYMANEVDQFNYSLQLNHQSFGTGPTNDEQSKESHSGLGFDGSYFTDFVEIFGGLKWNQDSYSFYGVDTATLNQPDFQTADNVLNTIRIEAGVRDVERVGPFSYEAKVSFMNFEDSYAANENDIGVQGTAKYRVNEDWTGGLGLAYFSTQVENLGLAQSRTFFSIQPSVSYRYGNFDFTAGINIVSENDSIENKSSDFRVFPAIKASYQFADEFGFFAEFSGNVDRKTYHSFVMENPFLGPVNRLLNTVNTYKFQAGIEGTFSEIFNYRGSVQLARYNQLYFFINSALEPSRFEITYDDKSTVISVGGELGMKISESYRLGANLNLYQYSLNTVEQAWHRPVWEIGVNNQIKPFKALLIQANLNFMGGIKAPTTPFQEDAPTPFTTLKTIADIQLLADYKITDRLSVFAQGNNLLNGKNTRWQNYPVRGIQLIGGLSYKF